ncbi:hypothetical protein M6B38_348600 [Iris pallida]|uniref:Uncharacterized protein n=1 Tax=Iris pallida TaxID=29817 RepID=A0AAX6GSH2_IRIPA|nr:hypothetical protein M6B38_348600 [Iris pallida]
MDHRNDRQQPSSRAHRTSPSPAIGPRRRTTVMASR